MPERICLTATSILYQPSQLSLVFGNATTNAPFNKTNNCSRDSLFAVASLRDAAAGLLDDTRDVSRAQLPPDDALDLGPQLVVEVASGGGHDEEAHSLVGVRGASPADADGVLDLGREEAREDVVDLGAAETHARGLENAIGAAEHEERPGGRVRDLHKVAVVPDGAFDAADVSEALKVGRLVFRVASGAEEGQGLAGEWGRADEVTRMGRVGEGFAREGVDGADGHAKARALDLADANGQEGARGAEKGDDIGPASDGSKVHLGREGLVDEGEGRGREGAGGRVDRLEGRKIDAGLVDGVDGVCLESGEVGGGGAEVGYAETGKEPREREVTVGLERGARVEDNGGADGEGRYGPVPHHPGGGRIVEHARG